MQDVGGSLSVARGSETPASVLEEDALYLNIQVRRVGERSFGDDCRAGERRQVADRAELLLLGAALVKHRARSALLARRFSDRIGE